MKIHGQATVELKVFLEITEVEARAIEAMAGYNIDEFIKTFYEKLGSAYMRDHEKGLRTFLETSRICLPSLLGKATQAREVFQTK